MILQRAFAAIRHWNSLAIILPQMNGAAYSATLTFQGPVQRNKGYAVRSGGDETRGLGGIYPKILESQRFRIRPRNGRRNPTIIRTGSWDRIGQFCAGGKNFCAVRSGGSSSP